MDSKLYANKNFVLVSDLDWTMVDHKDDSHESLCRFNRLWTSQLAGDSLLVFSTGRSPELFHTLAMDTPLLHPDVLVCSVGTEIMINGAPDAEWEAYLDEGWDRDQVAAVASRFPELVVQKVSEQRAHKVSYKLFAADAAQAAALVSNLRSQLSAAGLETNVVFSGGEDLDILPARASKGKALSFLLQQIEDATGGARPEKGVMVCGDSGNDVELFQVPNVLGCVVANAHPELREACEAAEGDAAPRIFFATADGPAGIVQALHHFGLAMDEANPQHAQQERRAAVIHQHAWFERWFGADPEGELTAEGEVELQAGMAALENALSEGFELITPAGAVTPREELLAWFREKGRGSKRPLQEAETATRPVTLSDAPQGLLSVAIAEAPMTPSGTSTPQSRGETGVFRIWVDRFSERQISPGVWTVRYMEMQQWFPGNVGTGGSRTARWSTAVMRKEETDADGDSWKWEGVHETWAPLTSAGNGPTSPRGLVRMGSSIAAAMLNFEPFSQR